MRYEEMERDLDRRSRVKKALKCYVGAMGTARPRPDREEDETLERILDRLSADVVELAAWFSESASWMMLADQCRPPMWLAPLLTPEEQEGLGRIPADAPGRTPPGERADPPAKKRTRRGKNALRLEPDPDDPYPCLRPEHIQYMTDHYDRLPTIDRETGRPIGELR